MNDERERLRKYMIPVEVEVTGKPFMILKKATHVRTSAVWLIELSDLIDFSLLLIRLVSTIRDNAVDHRPSGTNHLYTSKGDTVHLLQCI